jgi:WD40 repeat protein
LADGKGSGHSPANALAASLGPVSIEWRLDRRALRRRSDHPCQSGGPFHSARWSNEVAYPHNNSYIDNGALTFGPGGDTLITYQADPAVRVWDWRTTSLRYKINGHRDRCSGVSFSHDGKLLATASRDNTARIWDFATGRAVSDVLPHPDWVYTAQFHPQGELLVTSCRDSQVRVWNWRTGKLACPPFQHGHEVHTAAFMPDGRFAVTASEDNTARIWELVTGKPLTPTIPLTGPALNLEISPDGRRLVVGGFSTGSMHIISLDALFDADPLDARDRRVFAELTSSRSVGNTGGLANLSAEEWYAAWQGLRPRQAAYAADIERFKRNAFAGAPTRGAGSGQLAGNSSPPTPVPALPPPLPFLTVSDALKWSAPAGKTKQKYALAYSGDGRRLATRGASAVKVWSADDGTELAGIPTVAATEFYDFAFAPDGRILAAAAGDGVHLMDFEYGGELRVLNLDNEVKSSFHRLAFSPDGKWLAGAHLKGVKLWDTGSWKSVANIATGAGWIGSVAFNQDGKLLATAGQDKHVRTWDVAQWTLLHDHIGSSPAYTLAFSPDGATVAAAFSTAGVGQFLFWDASSGERIRSVRVHSKIAHTIAYRADGLRIATAGDDGAVALWDASSNRITLKFQAHEKSAYCAVFSRDGNSLATVGDDGVAKVWDVPKLEALAASITVAPADPSSLPRFAPPAISTQARE